MYFLPLRSRVIEELGNLWLTGRTPQDLEIHIDQLKGRQLGGSGDKEFLRQVFKDLCGNVRTAYQHTSKTAFMEWLFEECERIEAAAEQRRREQEAARAEQARKLAARAAEAAAHARAKARAEFAAITTQLAQARSRDELVKLGRRRSDLAPQTGMTYVYENHCWQCKSRVSSQINPRCPKCRWFICTCLPEGACGCNCPNRESNLYDYDDTF